MDVTLFYDFLNYDIFEVEREKLLKGLVEPDKIHVKDLLFLEPVKFSIDISRKGYKFFFDVHVESVVVIPCDRCLEDFNFPIKSDYKFLFEYNKEPSEYIKGHILNIKNLVLSEFYINIPLKKLCSENCRGLCPNCGVNLNNEDCNCNNKSFYGNSLKINLY